MGIVLGAGRDYGAALPVSALVSELMKSLVAQGHEDEDHSALVKAIEKMAGLQD